MALFDEFPYLKNDRIIIRKMTADDPEGLIDITGSEAVYRNISPFLYKKSPKALLTAIENLGGRDFDKKKMIIAGIYPASAPDRLIGPAEMFDYKKRQNSMTIGYRINEKYWHMGYGKCAAALMRDYLIDDMGLTSLNAYVMPENVYSAKILIGIGFTRENDPEERHDWGGQATAPVNAYTYKPPNHNHPSNELFAQGLKSQGNAYCHF